MNAFRGFDRKRKGYRNHMKRHAKKKINLALQGGGSHGAYTWGILDRLLTSELFEIDGISGTSAGAVNAILLAQGFMQNGVAGARQCLYDFWYKIGEYESLLSLMSFYNPVVKTISHLWMTMLSPYQFNQANLNPIKTILDDMLDIEGINYNCPVKLFITATNVKTGKIQVFEQPHLSVDAIIASTCIPKIFQATEIDSEFYWDGGYLGNPAIFPLISKTATKDILISHVTPIFRPKVPETTEEIDTRLIEISFNSSLMRELRAIAFITNLIDKGWIKDKYKKQLKKINVHLLNADSDLLEFSLPSFRDADWGFLQKLRDLGGKKCSIWLKEYYECIGKKGTINFKEWL